MSRRKTSSASPVKENLPPSVDFVGRASELREVLEALGPATRAWIISLTGVGGIGKTELAVQAARLALTRKLFESVVWITAKESWLTREGIQESEFAFVSLNELLDAVIKVLQLRPLSEAVETNPLPYEVSLDRKKNLVDKALRSTSCLLIVDNLETIQDQAIIRFLMDFPPGSSKALVTTRLGGLKAPDVAPAQTLEGQREIRIGPLSQEDAITLFIRRASAQGFQFSRAEHDAELKMVVAKIGYSPLAIEWVIGQMALNGDDLNVAIQRLNSSDSEFLKFCFDNLIAAVGSRAQKVLLAVSIFVDSVSEEILEEVTEMQPKSQGEHLEELARLNTASLVEKIGERYRVLAPTRLYVNSLQRDLAELYRQYCTRATEYYVRLLRNAEQKQQWNLFKNEQQNILSLLSWCFDNGHFELTIGLAHALSEYLQRLGLWDQRVYVCEIATEAASSLGNDSEAIQFIFDKAEIHKARGRLDDALEEFQRCEEYSKGVGDKKKAADAHMQVGIILYQKAQYADSIRTLQQSLEMYVANGDSQGIAINLTILGRNELELGHFDAALRYLEEGLDIKQQIDDQLGIAISQYDLGYLHHKLGDLQRAEDLFEESLKTIDQLGEKRHQANAGWYYALLQVDRGNLEAAKKYLKDVVDIEERLQRDARLKRANEKLREIQQAIDITRSIQASDRLPTPQSSDIEKLTDLAAKVMSILIAYVSMSTEEFTRKFGNAAYEKAKNVFATLKERWTWDKEAIENLLRFQGKPERYKLVLEDILQEKLDKDKDLAMKLSRLLQMNGTNAGNHSNTP